MFRHSGGIGHQLFSFKMNSEQYLVGSLFVFSQDVCLEWENTMEVADFLYFFINEPFPKLRRIFRTCAWAHAAHALTRALYCRGDVRFEI